MDRKITVNINLDLEILQQLEDAVQSGKVKSRSEAVRYFINLGFQMETLQSFDRNDPEFLQKVKSLLQSLEKTNELPLQLTEDMINLIRLDGLLSPEGRRYMRDFTKQLANTPPRSQQG